MIGPRLYIADKIAKKWVKIVYPWWQPNDIFLPKLDKTARKTRVFCSNPICCGNPRRYGKLTRQEIKANLLFKEGLNEIE